jgi:hypothetical protein
LSCTLTGCALSAHQLSELLAGTVQPLAKAFGATAKPLGQLLRGVAVHIVQDDKGTRIGFELL